MQRLSVEGGTLFLVVVVVVAASPNTHDALTPNSLLLSRVHSLVTYLVSRDTVVINAEHDVPVA